MVHSYTFVDENISPGKYLYRLRQINLDESCNYSKKVEVYIPVPAKFCLEQNYPNPFNPATTINYQIPIKSKVTLKVYNSLGEELITLVNENKNAGRYEVNFDGSKLVSGIYIYRLTAGRYAASKKLILLK